MSSLYPNMACPVVKQEIVQNGNGGQFWQGCVSIDLKSPCFSRTIDANNTRAIFNTWFETRNEEVKTNYAFPLQCSYYLKYNVDLYLGTVTYDPKTGNPIFTPNNKNSYVDCEDEVINENGGAVVQKNPLCTKDGTNDPGFFRPLFDLQNITLITTSATDKGSFPVYLLAVWMKIFIFGSIGGTLPMNNFLPHSSPIPLRDQLLRNPLHFSANQKSHRSYLSRNWHHQPHPRRSHENAPMLGQSDP